MKIPTFVLFCLPFLGIEANIKCALKEGVNTALNKISDRALKGLKFDGGRTKGNMQLFECTCEDDDVS